MNVYLYLLLIIHNFLLLLKHNLGICFALCFLCPCLGLASSLHIALLFINYLFMLNICSCAHCTNTHTHTRQSLRSVTHTHTTTQNRRKQLFQVRECALSRISQAAVACVCHVYSCMCASTVNPTVFALYLFLCDAETPLLLLPLVSVYLCVCVCVCVRLLIGFLLNLLKPRFALEASEKKMFNNSTL